jgi:uroporphyrinogen decarboxylase
VTGDKKESFMKSRERVLRAFKRRKGLPDRVPIQFDLCRSLLEYFGEKLSIPVSWTNHPYEDVTYRQSGNEIRLAMGADVVITGPAEAGDFVSETREGGTWKNEFGMRMRQGSIYAEVVEYPLKDVHSLSDLSSFSLPDPNAPDRYDDAADLVNRYKDDYLIIGDIEVTLLTLVQQLVGMEKLMMDMALQAEYLPALIKLCADFQIELGLNLIKRGVDALWIGDDFGSQNDLLFSVDMFREIWKPEYRRMIDTFKNENSEIIPILHCDGAVSKLLDDIIELGFEVFNPVQPGVPGHGPKELKEAFGSRINFWGAVDQQDLLPKGTDEEIETDIKEKIEVLGKDGGYMISLAHIIQPDVSPERVELFIDYAMRYGRYE